ncbi:MAG: TolC family protein [Rhodanobacteraceae bacterium]|nr:TolC family protein [Rhodanobacteraceae bacterium]
MIIRLRRPSLLAAVALLAGCVSVSRREGAEQVAQLARPRLAAAFAWDQAGDTAALQARSAELLAAPLTPDSAFRIAQLHSPEITTRYAELGIAQADVVAASRIGNPGLSASALADGGGSKISLSLDLPLADLLLLPARKRLAESEYQRAQLSIAAALVNLAADTADAWYAAAGAEQIASMHEAIAGAAAAAAELATRFHAAGNISALQLNHEQAAATQARIRALAARAEASRTRLALNTHLGLSSAQAAQWTLALPLAAPLDSDDALGDLQTLAQTQRLDPLAAQQEVAGLQQALTLARRWRLLGQMEVGAEREREADGKRLSGPALSLALPLFDQGQAAIARAQARLEQGQAALTRLRLDIDNEVRAGVERVAAQREIAQTYRTALIPQREAIVAGEGERYNYMLIGAFELLQAKQQEFDAYQAYLEAVRDYWQARVALTRAVGTLLPSDAQPQQPALDMERVLRPAASGHDSHKHHSPKTDASHGGHGNHEDGNHDAQTLQQEDSP